MHMNKPFKTCIPVIQEQGKWSDIEQQPPFDDCKWNNTAANGDGGTKPTGTTLKKIDKVWSGVPDSRFGKLFLIRDANNFDKSQQFGLMYPIEFETKFTTKINTSESFLELLLSIGRGGTSTTNVP